MIRHAVEQGTDAWYALRLGKPTASAFERILTPTGKPSAQQDAYAHMLLAERILGRSMDTVHLGGWAERGRELEHRAVAMYEFENGAETMPGGFITTDDGRIGASPDRLLKYGMDLAAVEIKCPAPHTHVGYLLDGFGKDYRVQAQGQIWVCELDFVDRYSFHPELPPAMLRTYRDDDFITKIASEVRDFADRLDEMEQRLRELGAFDAVRDHAAAMEDA